MTDNESVKYGTTSHSFRPFGDHKAEYPDMCIHCNSVVIRLTKKLPRTFTCSNRHSFTIGEYRKYKLKRKIYIGKV